MFKRIDHVEMVPSDFDRTLKFYSEILGFRILFRRKTGRVPMEEMAFIRLGDSLIEMFSIKNPAPAPASKADYQVGCRKIALEVEDMTKTLEYLKSKGVEITGGPSPIQNDITASINDPDGLSIQLVQRGAR